MPRRHRPSPLATLGTILIALLLAACAGQDAPPTPAVTRPPTQPPVVTRIVPPPPTYTPVPTATLAYDLGIAAGPWSLRFELAITSGSLMERLSYFGTAQLTVTETGAIAGTGSFSPQVDGGRCVAQLLDSTPLAFTVRGQTRAEGEQVWADAQLVPQNPDQPEPYRVTCPDRYDDVREWSEPTLWPLLAQIDRLAWSFPLESGHTIALDVSLPEATGGAFDGALTGELRLAR